MRLTVVIVSQYVQILNHHVVPLNITRYVNYTSIKKKKEKQRNKNGSFTFLPSSDIRREPRMKTALKIFYNTHGVVKGKRIRYDVMRLSTFFKSKCICQLWMQSKQHSISVA